MKNVGNKLNLMDALKLAGAITLGSLVGCGGTALEYSNLRNLKRDVQSEGIYADPEAMVDLRLVAGVLAGKMEYIVTKYENGYKAYFEGIYSQRENPEAMKDAIRLADVDKDGRVTKEEAAELKNYIIDYMVKEIDK